MFNAFPLVRHLLFLIAGIIFYINTGWFHTSVYIVVIVVLVAATFLSLYLKKQWLRGSLILSLFFVSGIVITHQNTPITYSKHYLHHFYFDAYQARVTANAETKPKTYKAEAEILAVRINGKWQKSSGKILLYVPLDAVSKPIYGDVFLINSLPREVEPPKNPLEFNYKAYLQRKGIYAHHFVRAENLRFIENNPPNYLIKAANQLRAYAEAINKQYLKEPQLYGIANAMLLGLRDEIDHDLQSAYSATGAVHVLSVSGMHVGILYLLLQFLFGKLTLTGKPKRKEYPKKQYLFTILIIVILFFYAILTGLSASVVRAAVMFSLLQVAPLVGRKNATFNTVALSAILLLFYNPYWLYDVGFQLSYLAILGILWLYTPLYQLVTFPKYTTWVWSGLSVSLSAQLLTFPLSVYYFHQFPNYFLLTNLCIGFASMLIMYTGFALLSLAPIFTLGASWIAAILGWLLKGMNGIIFAIEQFPFSVYSGISLSVAEVALIYIGSIAFVSFFLKKEIQYIVVATLSCLLLIGSAVVKDLSQTHNNEITFHFIPKQTAISIVHGKQTALLANAELQNDPRLYDFHFKNYYDSLGITRIKKQVIEKTQAVVKVKYQQIGITWIRQKTKTPLTEGNQYLLVSNNSVRQLEKIIKTQKPKLLIIDNSNSKYTTEKLIEQAKQLHIPYISLYEEGSFTLTSDITI